MVTSKIIVVKVANTDYITKNITKTIGIKPCTVCIEAMLEQKHFVNFTRCLTCKWACTSSHTVRKS